MDHQKRYTDITKKSSQHTGVNNSCLVATNIKSRRLGLDHSRNILCHGSLLGCGHQTLGSQDTGQFGDGGVHAWCRDTLVELVLSILYFLDQLGSSNDRGSSSPGLLSKRTLGKDQNDGILFDGFLQENRGTDGLRVLLSLGVGLNVDLNQVVGFADFLGLKSWSE